MIKIEVECIDEKIELLERIKDLNKKMKKSYDKEGDKMFDEDELTDFPFYVDPFLIKLNCESGVQNMINKLVDEYWNNSDVELGYENENYYFCHKKEKHVVYLDSKSSWDEFRNERIRLKNFFESLQ